MQLPRFTIRTLLVSALGVAVVAMLGGPSFGGRVWAIGMTIAIASVGAALLFQAAFYVVLRVLSRYLGAEEPVARTARGGIEGGDGANAILERGGDAGNIGKLVLALLLTGTASNAHAQGAPPLPPMGPMSLPPGLPQMGPANIMGIADDRFMFLGEGQDGRIVSGPNLVSTKTGDPVLDFSPNTGLQVTIDASEINAFGYGPVVIKVRQKSAATVDRTIDFKLFASGRRSSERRLSSAVRFTLNKGADRATARMFVPTYNIWQSWGWQVEVDGQLDRALSPELLGWVRSNQNNGPLVMLLGRAASVEPRLAQALQRSQGGQGYATIFRRKETELPDDWLGYSGTDLVVAMASELAPLAKNHPQETEALLRWVRSGGNLWLMDAGEGWEQMAAVNRVLAGTPTDKAEAGADSGASDAAFLTAGWRVAAIGETANDAIDGAMLASGVTAPVRGLKRQPGAKTFDELLERSRELDDVTRRGLSINWFVVRGHGFGLVTAFRSGNSWGGAIGATPVRGISRSLLAPRLSWGDRMGNQPDRSNPQFNNWLIPDVGVAPVGQFQILITLFVLGIGPLNYWWLSRRGKLPLLLVTTPIAAAATTGLLFAYGVLADGVGVQLRARSVTLLDQRTGEAAAWARQSYYAGLAPREGMTFDAQTTIYPLLPDWAPEMQFGGESTGALREVVWNDAQRLPRGWLSSRTPTQYLAVTAQPTEKRLDIRADGDELRIANRLGAAVRTLIVEDGGGKFYLCEGLAKGATKLVNAVEKDSLGGALRREFSANFPEYPPGADPAQMGQTGYYGPVLSRNLMESLIEALNSPTIESWGPRTFLAITEQGLLIGPGVDGAEEEASFHVVRGTW